MEIRICVSKHYRNNSYMPRFDIPWLDVKYVEHYIHTISLESKYRHVNIDPIAFQYTYANLHEMGLSTISLDSMGKHYYRNDTTL